jgi:hypothetical protein
MLCSLSPETVSGALQGPRTTLCKPLTYEINPRLLSRGAGPSFHVLASFPFLTSASLPSPHDRHTPATPVPPAPVAVARLPGASLADSFQSQPERADNRRLRRLLARG